MWAVASEMIGIGVEAIFAEMSLSACVYLRDMDWAGNCCDYRVRSTRCAAINFASSHSKVGSGLFLFLFRGFFVNFPFKGQGSRSRTSSPAVGKASRSNETTWSELVRLSGQAVLPLPQQRWPREELHPPSDPETGFWVFRPVDRPIQREPLQN